MLDNNVKKTMIGMMIGVTIYNLLVIVFSIIFFTIYYKSNNVTNFHILILKNEICVVIGLISCILGVYSMATSIYKSVSANDENFAKRHILINTILRITVFIILLTVIINEKVFGLVGGIMYAVSVFGIKIGAYMAPTIMKKLK